jgi:hypothetical protein
MTDRPRHPRLGVLCSARVGNRQNGHFRPSNDFCAMSAIQPIATRLLHLGKWRDGPRADLALNCHLSCIT